MGNQVTKKIIAVACILLLLITGIYISTLTISRQDKTLVTISIFPEDARVTMNGEVVKPGKTYLSPGIYAVEATRDGFDNYSTVVTLEENEQTVAISLNATTEEGREYIKENQAAYTKTYGAGQQAAAEIGKIFNDRNPIAKRLPYKTFVYSIGYRMDQTDPSGNSIILTIDASEGYKQAALYRIRQLGYDPTDFTINFRNYENPFAL